MSKIMKRSLYVGLSALMVLSTASASANNLNVNAAHRHSHTSRRAHKSVRRHYFITDEWTKSGAFDHKLTGHYSVFNKPSILRGAKIVGYRKNVKNMRIFAYSGRMYNHIYRYYHVISKNGKVNGWIKAAGVKYVPRKRNIPKGHFSRADIKAYKGIEADAVRAQLTSTMSKTVSGAEAKRDMGQAVKAYKDSQSLAKGISNRRLKKAANKLVKEIKGYIDTIKASKGKAEKSYQDTLEENVTDDIHTAQGWLNYASKHNNKNATNYLKMSKEVLAQASAKNAKISNGEVRPQNASLISIVENYRNEIIAGKKAKKSGQVVKPSVIDQSSNNAKALNDVESFSALARSEAMNILNAKGNAAYATSCMNKLYGYRDMATQASKLIKGNASMTSEAKSDIKGITSGLE